MIEREPSSYLESVQVDFAPPSITGAELKAVEAVLRSGWLTTGPVEEVAPWPPPIRRRRLVARYRDRLAGASCGVEPIPAVRDLRSVDHLLVVALPESVDRPTLQHDLAQRGVPTSVHFRPVRTLSWAKSTCSVVAGGTPGADAVASRALSLPLSSTRSIGEVDYVCDVLFELVSS